MSFSGAQVTRLGLYGGTRPLYGDFTGKAEQEVVELTGGAKRKIVYEDIEPLWKQEERKTDWVDQVIAKEKIKLKQHKPDIIQVADTIDEQIREIYQAQAVRAKRKRKNKAMALILMEM